MRKDKLFPVLVLAVALIAFVPAGSCFAQSVADMRLEYGESLGVIVLTPGHSQTIYYELAGTLLGGGTTAHVTLIFTLGTGTLNVGIANHSPISQGSEIVYFTAGLVGTSPVLNYSYSGAPIAFAVPMGSAGVGMLVTGLLAEVGSPELPVTMSMQFSLF